ncbi:MAG: PASTA domain-containing protein [Chloroflexota bacterium]
MKTAPLVILSVILSACSFSSSPSVPSFQLSEFVSMKGQASTEKETQISLDDGASISLPPNSIDGEATVNIERNPEKIKNLPPLPKEMIQLSDFYNFEIEGANLIGPVDLFIPVDKTLVPDQQGILFAMIPSENGWKYIPVEIKDGKANIYTDELGDPLIAWRFTDPDWTDEEINKSKYICDPDISVQVIDNGDGIFRIVGQVKPPRAHLFLGSSIFERKPASNIPVSITLNLRDPESGEKLDTTTDMNGNFELTIDTTNGIREGWNWVFVNAKCDPWFLEVSVESTGYAEFEYAPITQNSTDTAIEIPVANPETIQPPKTPTEYVLLPNVASLPFDTAKEVLERIGYKVIWIDGKSNLEVGQMYSQAPKAGSITLPHRTTVVIYRTIEKTDVPPECAQFNLTPEECANSGSHEYSCVNTGVAPGGPYSESRKITITRVFSSNSFSIEDFVCNKTMQNFYECKEEYGTNVFIFTESGYKAEFKVFEEFDCTTNYGNSYCSWDQVTECTLIK